MRSSQLVLVLLLCCLVCSGCGAAKIAELTAEVEALKAKTAQLEASNAQLQSQLATAQRELENVQRIKQGYELARSELKKNLSQLAPLLGNAELPLPPFEKLTDSSWIGKLAPAAKISSGLKDLQQELKALLGSEPAKPKAKP